MWDEERAGEGWDTPTDPARAADRPPAGDEHDPAWTEKDPPSLAERPRAKAVVVIVVVAVLVLTLVLCCVAIGQLGQLSRLRLPPV